MNTILYFIALLPLKSLVIPSGSHTNSCFSARAEIPFDYMRFVQPGAQFGPG